ncbi:MAG: hypothetical protein CMA53_03735 [Euryarchaeota archaeon]|nr:hypothetical protein [Euryarchaeota archaeon]|tara:strand:+ start:430 stop:624 length:195 start_codon:yes stop_codon:yes gene_type:complete
MALMVSVSSSPPHSLNGIGCAQRVQNGGVLVSTKVTKTTNGILYGPPSGGSAPTGAEAQSWSDG